MQDSSQIAAIVFDAYGTLFDVGSLEDACRGAVSDPAPFVALWRAKQLEYTFLRSLMERHVDFRTVTDEALRYTATRLGVNLGPTDPARLMGAWLHVAAYSDVRPALERLRRWPLAILSNGTPPMLDAALEHNGLASLFSHILSVEEVGAYKPSPRVYQLAVERLGVAREQILFVSTNPFDVLGAGAFGFVVGWVNRSGTTLDPIGPTPAYEVRTLLELASRVTSDEMEGG